MNAPKKMRAALPVDTTAAPLVDLSLEKPVLGTMNYARKFSAPEGGYAAPGIPLNVAAKKPAVKKQSLPIAEYADGTKGIKAKTTSNKRMRSRPVEDLRLADGSLLDPVANAVVDLPAKKGKMMWSKAPTNIDEVSDYARAAIAQSEAAGQVDTDDALLAPKKKKYMGGTKSIKTAKK